MNKILSIKFFLTLLILFFSLFGLAESSQAAEYYLNPASGNDTNDGSISSPWKTMNKVVTSVSAGDTVYVRGGTYTENQYLDLSVTTDGILQWRAYSPYKLGAPGNPITISAMPGEQVVFDGEGNSYFLFFNSIYTTGYPGHYVIIKDLKFTDFGNSVIRGGYKDSYGLYGAKNIVIDNCLFTNMRDTTSAPVSFAFDSKNIIIKNSRIENGSLPPIQNNWDHGIYPAEGLENFIIEGTTIKNIGGFGIHMYGHNDYSLNSKNLILRNNAVINAHDYQFIMSSTNYEDAYIYHNTFYTTHNPYPLRDNQDASGDVYFGGGYNNIVFKNNIAYGPVSVSNIRWTGTDFGIFNDFAIDYNIWLNTNNQNMFASRYDYATSKDTYYTFDQFKQNTGQEQHSLLIDPQFNNPASFDLTLSANSPARDAGTYLTKTITSDSGKAITVEDAGYFHDGFDMIEGDTIQIGTKTAVITDIDYTTNIITVDRDIVWNQGELVTLPYSGSAPDIGAYEYSHASTDTTPPSAPSGLTIN